MGNNPTSPSVLERLTPSTVNLECGKFTQKPISPASPSDQSSSLSVDNGKSRVRKLCVRLSLCVWDSVFFQGHGLAYNSRANQEKTRHTVNCACKLNKEHCLLPASDHRQESLPFLGRKGIVHLSRQPLHHTLHYSYSY